MAEYIDREALVADMEERWTCMAEEYGFLDSHVRGFQSAIAHVEAYNTANVVNVVRCKDCIHHHTFACRMVNPTDDDWCRYGEMKND